MFSLLPLGEGSGMRVELPQAEGFEKLLMKVMKKSITKFVMLF
jgi:hypothetical protein